MIKLRIEGSEQEIKKFTYFLDKALGDAIQEFGTVASTSKFYHNRCGESIKGFEGKCYESIGRVYVEVE